MVNKIECVYSLQGERENCDLCGSNLVYTDEGFLTCVKITCGIIYKATSRDGKLMDMEVILPKLVTETKEDIKALMLQDALDFPEDIITLISVFVGECSFFFFIFVFSYIQKR